LTGHAPGVTKVAYLISLRGALNVGGISDRAQEIKRRRHRKKKLAIFKRRLKKATVSEKAVIADKIRRLTPGGEVIVEAWGLLPK
jgi:uncharacterized protein DUF6800